MDFEIDIKMNLSALYDYNMYYNYSRPVGLIGSVIGVFCLIFYARYGALYYLMFGLLILFYTPIELYVRSLKQFKLNPVYKKSTHFLMNDEGVSVTIGEHSMTVEWEQMYKAASTNQSILLFTAKGSAWVFPKTELGERRYELIEMISTHMPASKVRIKQ